MQLLEDTANNAQSYSAQRALGRALERLEAALDGNADPGSHLLRPSAIRVGYSAKEGQYLAFILQYQLLLGRSPAEADMQSYFGASPPAVHSMVLRLQRWRFISRTPGMPRSIQVLLRPDQIPPLDGSERTGRGLTRR
jgi:repressor LexA